MFPQRRENPPVYLLLVYYNHTVPALLFIGLFEKAFNFIFNNWRRFNKTVTAYYVIYTRRFQIFSIKIVSAKFFHPAFDSANIYARRICYIMRSNLLSRPLGFYTCKVYSIPKPLLLSFSWGKFAPFCCISY